jgi:hypothetical protein
VDDEEIPGFAHPDRALEHGHRLRERSLREAVADLVFLPFQDAADQAVDLMLRGEPAERQRQNEKGKCSGASRGCIRPRSRLAQLSQIKAGRLRVPVFCPRRCAERAARLSAAVLTIEAAKDGLTAFIQP